jgi:hypothetical protein
MKVSVKIKGLPGLIGGLILAIALAATTASGNDKTISMNGSLGKFINLGATA